MFFGLTPEAAAAVGALFAIAMLEAMPPWGRSIPGHLAIAGVAAIAVALQAAPWWLPLAPIVGALLSDIGSYAWLRLRPLRGVWRGRTWWRAGLDVDDLAQQLHRAPFRTFLHAKFNTNERARLAYASARTGLRAAPFAALSLVANAVWAPAWVLVGAIIGGITLVLPSEGDFIVLAVSLVTLATLVSRPAPTPA